MADTLSVWLHAIAAWEAARSADWHPGKAAAVEAARLECGKASRAHYAARTAALQAAGL